MVIFDQLRISDNGKVLYLDAHVNKASYFDNIYIERIVIQTQDQVSEADPLSPGDSNVYDVTVTPTKVVHYALNASADFKTSLGTLSNKLLFVYIICNGCPDACTPCRLDERTTLGVTFDEALLYQQVMGYTKELTNSCKMPQDFVDFILNWNAFKASVETEHYIPAIKFWEMLFGKGNAFAYKTTKPCGCHG
jgi:hypothetical protein